MFLKDPSDESDTYHLKTSAKEDEDFVIVSHEAWQYLEQIYGGVDVRRQSIKIITDADDENDTRNSDNQII